VYTFCCPRDVRVVPSVPFPVFKVPELEWHHPVYMMYECVVCLGETTNHFVLDSDIIENSTHNFRLSENLQLKSQHASLGFLKTRGPF
jgi:hypothetical protein